VNNTRQAISLKNKRKDEEQKQKKRKMLDGLFAKKEKKKRDIGRFGDHSSLCIVSQC